MAEDYSQALIKVKSILKDNPAGLTIGQVSAKVGINRNSVAKYLDVLNISGQVTLRAFGPAKVYYLSSRVPLSAMMSYTSDGIICLAKNLKVIQANTRGVELIGKSANEVIGFLLSDLLPHVAKNLSHDLEVSVKGKQTTSECTCVHDGIERICKVVMIPTTFDDGSLGVTLVIADITDQKRVEALVQNERKQFKAIAETLTCGIEEIDMSGKILWANSAHHKMHGYAPGELIGKTIYDIMPEDIVASARERIRLIELGKINSDPFFTVNKKKDGTEIQIRLDWNGKRDNNGKVIGIISALTDISSENRLNKASAFLASIVESTEDAVLSADTNGKITSWNDGAKNLFEYTGGEIIGKNIRILSANESDDQMKIIAAIKTGKSITKDIFRKNKKGKNVPVHATFSPIRDQNGEVIGISAIMKNRTDNIKRHKEVLKFASTLDYLDKAVFIMDSKGNFNFVNKFTKYLGYTPGELNKLNVVDIAPEIAKMGWPKVWARIKKEGSFAMKTTHKAKDGTLFNVIITTGLLHIDDEYCNSSIVTVLGKKK